MSGEETTLTESGLVKREVSKKEFLEWFGGGEVERKEVSDAMDFISSAND